MPVGRVLSVKYAADGDSKDANLIFDDCVNVLIAAKATSTEPVYVFNEEVKRLRDAEC